MICGTNARATPPNVLESLALDPAVTTYYVGDTPAGQSFTAGGRQTSTGTKTIDVSSITTTQSILIGGATSDGNTYRIYVDKIWAE